MIGSLFSFGVLNFRNLLNFLKKYIINWISLKNLSNESIHHTKFLNLSKSYLFSYNGHSLWRNNIKTPINYNPTQRCEHENISTYQQQWFPWFYYYWTWSQRTQQYTSSFQTLSHWWCWKYRSSWNSSLTQFDCTERCRSSFVKICFVLYTSNSQWTPSKLSGQR